MTAGLDRTKFLVRIRLQRTMFGCDTDTSDQAWEWVCEHARRCAVDFWIYTPVPEGEEWRQVFASGTLHAPTTLKFGGLAADEPRSTNQQGATPTP